MAFRTETIQIRVTPSSDGGDCEIQIYPIGLGPHSEKLIEVMKSIGKHFKGMRVTGVTLVEGTEQTEAGTIPDEA